MHENLANLCRICFGEGEYNIWEYKVQLPAEVAEVENQDNALDEKLSVQQMLSPFIKEQAAEELNAEVALIHLICHYCLDELVPSFLFYRKLKQADKKLAAFLNDMAMETISNGEQQIVEYLEEQPGEIVEEFLIGAENESDDKPVEEEVCSATATLETSDNLTQNYVEVIAEEQPITQATTIIGHKRRKLAKNPKFVLTGGVTQMLSHIHQMTADSEQYDDVPNDPQQHVPLSQQKRLKIREREKAELEQGSFVVTQFIPSTTTQLHKDTLFRNAAKNPQQTSLSDNPMAGNELRTMDYAAVEINASANELHVNETDVPPEIIDAELAPLNQAIYFCKYCPQAFSAVSFLTTHMRKRHVCKFCTQGFSQSTQLYEHIRSSHNEHKCAICGKELSTHSNLRSHIKRVHGVKLPAQVELLDYRRHRLVTNSTQDGVQAELAETLTESLNANYTEIHKEEYEEQQQFIEL